MYANMATVKIDPKHPDAKSISMAARTLKKGGIVAFPTDTVYGIGAMPFNKKAVGKLYDIKKRGKKKPIAILVSSKKIAGKFAADIPSKAKKLMAKYWPGPLTLIFKKKKSIPDFLTSGLPTIGIRMPKNDIALKLIKKAGGSLAVTSANISGNKPATSARQIKGLKRIDIILDGGKCKVGIPSAVIAVVGGKPRLLRKGPRNYIPS
jgi:L-threonylcarbamoyladenylate synthase